MSNCQVRIKNTTIQSSPSSIQVQEEDRKIIRELPNRFGIAEDLLIVVFYANGEDDDRALCRVLI